MQRICADIAKARLASQHISQKKFSSAKALVSYMGAIQAQDYPMSKWAIGVRAKGITEKEVEEAINKGDILRTHLLRPTWHLVSGDDIRWMLELTAPSIKSSLKSRHNGLGITDEILIGLYNLLETNLGGGNHLTREELNNLFKNAGIPNDNNRVAHILLSAELDGIICSGTLKNNKPTYALLGERVPAKQSLTREEALERLARTYFTSRAPATLKDFTWWSGLKINDAKRAVQLLSEDFVREKIDADTYLFPQSMQELTTAKEAAFLLPAYDEFLISYSNRSAMITVKNQKIAISQNGLFRPVIIIDGKAAGTWKRTGEKDGVVLELEPFKPLRKQHLSAIKKALASMEGFYGKEIMLMA